MKILWISNIQLAIICISEFWLNLTCTYLIESYVHLLINIYSYSRSQTVFCWHRFWFYRCSIILQVLALFLLISLYYLQASDVLAVELLQKDARLTVSGDLGRPCPGGTYVRFIYSLSTKFPHQFIFTVNLHLYDQINIWIWKHLWMIYWTMNLKADYNIPIGHTM
jgi:hypothetical protein